MIVEILLHSRVHPGLRARIDVEDYGKVCQYLWHPQKHRHTFYAATVFMGEDGKRVHLLMHRLILNPSDRQQVDHQNGDGLDNVRTNLRPCTHAQNLHNSRARSKSGYKGVYETPSGWQVMITVNGRSKNVGRSRDRDEAARMYDAAAKEHYGEFARLNFPQ